MPTYVYQCDAPGCGHRFETVHSMAACDDPGATPPCPACGAATTHRAPQRVAVNWGGLPPSAGALAPAVRALVDEDNRQRRMEAYAAEKAARGETGC
ncbi:MAG: hypothetical protein Kow00120_23750 [Anaerolineae bacterium]